MAFEHTPAMKIVFLCSSKYYYRKMSRVRFHGIEALACENIEVKITGPGFEGWQEGESALDNLNKLFPGFHPGVVIGYKPLEIKGFADLPYDKVIRYNEMWDKKWTVKEITASKADVVICHHYNDYLEYKKMFKNYKLHDIEFKYIGHHAKASVFKDYGEEKDVDIMLIGALRRDIYPLRHKWSELLPRFAKDYRVEYFNHPGYDVEDAHTDKYLIDFAKAISKAKIVLSCSTYTNNRLGKYIEVPMCHTLMAADMFVAGPMMPNLSRTEEQKEREEELFEKYLIKSSVSDSQNELYQKVVDVLEDKGLYDEKMRAARQIGEFYTQEQYSAQLVDALWFRLMKSVPSVSKYDHLPCGPHNYRSQNETE